MPPIDRQDEAGRHERERFFGAAKLIAGLTMCSRVAGLARDMLLAGMFGASRLTDAFWLAFMIPNLFRRLFGEGALSAAFVPVFSETAELHGRDRAAALLANVMGLLSLLLMGIYLLAVVALLAVFWLVPGGIDRQMLVGYTAVMMPFMVTVCVLALGSAALNCVRHFAYPAAAPILLNLGIIAAALWLAPRWSDVHQQLVVVGVSIVLAGCLQLAALAWVLRAHNLPIAMRLRPLEPGIRRMITMAGPMLIGLSVLQVNALGDKLIGWLFTATRDNPTFSLAGHVITKPLDPAVVTWMNFGERLYQFPLGVLAIALGTAVFPLFSRYAARGDRLALRDSVNRAMRLAIFEGLPSGVGLLLLAGPLTAAIFARGKFTVYDAGQTAHLVRFYGLGMWAFCTQQILLRAFYAQKDTRTPLKVACTVVFVNFALNLVLIWVPAIRHGAFGLSTSITATINVIVLSWVLRRRLGRLGLRKLLASFARTAGATAVMAAAVGGVLIYAPAYVARSTVLLVAMAVGAGVAAFFAAVLALRGPELGELLARPGRQKPDAP